MRKLRVSSLRLGVWGLKKKDSMSRSGVREVFRKVTILKIEKLR